MSEMLLALLYVVVFLQDIMAYTYKRHPDENLTITQCISKYGYPVETHNLITDDDYMLTTHRIPHGKESKVSDKVVLLAHGLGGKAEQFILLGENALAFFLADRGFDVWLFNARGSVHSRKHKTLKPTFFQGARYWNFSWHEIGMFDLPANMDYILQKTNASKLFYAGHSQGCTSFFVLMSERPEYNSKVEASICLAPPILMNYITQPIVKMVSGVYPFLQQLLDMLNYYEFVIPNSPMVNRILKSVCTMSKDFENVCMDLIYIIGGDNSGLVKIPISLILTHIPAGFSTRQAMHYAQGVKSGYFRQFDYGTKGNLIKYNRKSPPEYNLSNIVVPLGLFYSKGDQLATVQQIKPLLKLLPNVVVEYLIPDDKFNHLDFLLAYNAAELVYEPIYEMFMSFNTK